MSDEISTHNLLLGFSVGLLSTLQATKKDARDMQKYYKGSRKDTYEGQCETEAWFLEGEIDVLIDNLLAYRVEDW